VVTRYFPRSSRRSGLCRDRNNARRPFRASIRRAKIITIWEERSRSGWFTFTGGSQTELPEMFGVNRSTISRDTKEIFQRNRVAMCPTCDNVLGMTRINELEEQGRIRITSSL
jgi:hypothetical protein